MRVRVIYSGRVQGVGFRATARDCARGLPLTGFVRNEPDGTVLLEAQGKTASIEELLSRIASHMGRNIIRVDRAEIPDREGERAFEIRR